MYEAYYQLSQRPFQLSPDPRFYFASRAHKRAMSYLRYGLNQGEGFIVITGDVGTGKTTLVRNLFAELSDEDVFAVQMVTTQLDPEDTLRMVASSFGVEHEGSSKAAVLERLEKFLHQKAAEGKRTLLVVDEAQNLSPPALEELRMLSNFQAGDRPLLQSFLLGQEEFRKTLQANNLEQLRQRIIAAYHLTPLDVDETKEYIEHRLRLVGWTGDPMFTDTAYADIHRDSYGIPRRINALCDRLMLFSYLEQRHDLDEKVVQQVVAELQEERAAISVGGDDRVPVDSGQTSSVYVSTPIVAADLVGSGVDERMRRLEKALDDLELTVRREQALVRRSLLFNQESDS
jgi:putative secretion ATPase (PEP-CTERM system associated)